MSKKRKCNKIYDEDSHAIVKHYDMYDKNGYVKYPRLVSSKTIHSLNEQIDYLQKILRPSDTVFDEDRDNE